MISAIKNRYALIPYLYSHMLSIRFVGGTYFKPVFFEFPNNATAYGIENTFMLGSALKVSQTVNKLGNSWELFYFPEGMWCPLWNMHEPCLNVTENGFLNMTATADVSHLHLREGHIAPMVNVTGKNVMTVKNVQELPIDLHISPTSNDETFEGFTAFAESFNVDNGETYESTNVHNQTVNQYQFALEAQTNERFLITFRLKFNASFFDDNKGCIASTANDFLGDVYVHNAVKYNISSDELIAQFHFRNATNDF